MAHRALYVLARSSPLTLALTPSALTDCNLTQNANFTGTIVVCRSITLDTARKGRANSSGRTVGAKQRAEPHLQLRRQLQ